MCLLADNWSKEPQSIVDYSRSPDSGNSAAPDTLFEISTITDESGVGNYPYYGTSTTHTSWSRDAGADVVYIAFGEALGWMQSPFGSGYSLMDVHCAGA